jgi:hypothetical protein
VGWGGWVGWGGVGGGAERLHGGAIRVCEVEFKIYKSIEQITIKITKQINTKNQIINDYV